MKLILPVFLALLTAMVPARAATILHDSFHANAGAANAVNGIYKGTTGSGGDAALGAGDNLHQAGGSISGFSAEMPWESESSYHRVRTESLLNPSRMGNDFHGAVLTLNFWGASRNSIRSVWRPIHSVPASSTYYMSSVMAVRWVGTEASSGHGIGWLYNGFGDASIASDGYANTTSFGTQPVPDTTGELFQGLQWGFRVNANNNGFDLVLRGRNASKDAIIEHVILTSDQILSFGGNPTANYFVGLKVEINPEGVDTVTYWVNPSFSATEPDGGTTVTVFNAFDSVAGLTHFGALTRGIRSHTSANTGESGRYDDVSLGTTWASVVGTSTDEAPPPVATRVFDPFHATGEADPANGIYQGGTVEAAMLGGPNNLSQTGGAMHGFTSFHPWQRISSYHRVQGFSLNNPSRLSDSFSGTVRTFNFVGASRNNMRSVWRDVGPIIPSDTYYMSSVMAVRWVGETATSGNGIGWLYNGFGDHLIARDGLAEGATHPALPAPSATPEIFQGLQWGFRVNAANDGFDLVLRGRNAARDAIIEHVILPSSQVGNFAANSSNTYFVALKVKIDPNGADEVTYWVNPPFSLTEPPGGVTLSIFDAFDSPETLTHFGALTRGINSSASGFHENGSGRYGSISLGTSWHETVTPQPPPAWEVAPIAQSATRVTMRAESWSAGGGDVRYYFENVDQPGSSSGWVSEPEWTEHRLAPESTHRYRYKARSLTPSFSETIWSEVRAAETPAETDLNPPLPNPPQWATEPVLTGPNTISMRAAAGHDPEGNGPVEYYFANLTNPPLDSGWQLSPEFSATGLDYETSYSFAFKTRDVSANLNETSFASPLAATTGPAPELGVFARASGSWSSSRLGAHVSYQVFHQTGSTSAPAPVILYLTGTALPRIGLENDTSILSDFIAEGYIVIVVDYHGNESARHPILDWDLFDLRKEVVSTGPGSILHGTGLEPDEIDVYALPAGYRLVRDLVYWDIEKHGAFGTLNRIMNTYNGHVVNRFGVDPVTDPAAMRGPNGEEIDYLLRMDIAYPSHAAEPVPLIFESSTQSTRLRAYRPAGDRAPYFLGKMTNGFAWAMVDHCYNPLARDNYYGHWDQYSLDDWNGLASITAAVRFLRAHAARFSLDPDLFAGMGHSKGSYTVTRLADPDHETQGERFTFTGQPRGSIEAQPWPGFSSRISASYQSMGNGTRRTELVTANNVPTIVACGLFDEYNQWLVFPDLVATYEALDLNHLPLWMTELGHDLPRNFDPILGRDRYELVFDFFRQYLQFQSNTAPEALYFLPAPGHDDLPLSGLSRRTPSPELLPEGKENLAVAEVPVSVFFAPPVDVASANAGGLRIHRSGTGEEIKGIWQASLGSAMLSFIPERLLPDNDELELQVTSALRSIHGVSHVGVRSHSFTTGMLSAAYRSWADSHGLAGADAQMRADPFGSGIRNLTAFALGLNPATDRLSDALEWGRSDNGSGGFIFYLDFPAPRPELSYKVEFTIDLTNWQTAEHIVLGGPENLVRGYRSIAPEESRLFLRLAVEPE